MSEPRLDLAASLGAHRVLAIVRGQDPDASLRAGVALAEQGIHLIEVSLTGKDSLDVITRLVQEAPEALVGAGTVLDADQVHQAQQAGAQYIVTPGSAPSVPQAMACGLPVLVGALTPSEVLAAMAAGADAVKIFPASVFGPGYVTALRAPIPQTPLVAVGGVDIDRAKDYLRSGATAVGVGSPLLGDAPDGGSIDELRARAQRLLAAVAELSP